MSNFRSLRNSKKIANPKYRLITIFFNSQKVLKAIMFAFTSQENWYLRNFIYQKTKKFQQIENYITFEQILGYCRIIKNEKTDLLAQKKPKKQKTH